MQSSGQLLPKDEPIKFLALGDSYTIGESVEEDKRWPVQLVKVLTTKGYKCHSPEIIATTGWRTDDLKKSITNSQSSKDYNLVSLLIGVNNQYQNKSMNTYAADFEALLNLAIEFAGNDKSKVMVISIPDYGFTPAGKCNQQKISQEIDAFNAVNKSITDRKGARYINITDISRQGLEEPDLVAEDGLHPSGKMYAMWVEKIISEVGW